MDADSAFANISGSNSVNVFLGIGLPWLITTVYDHIHSQTATQIANADVYSVSLLTFFAASGIAFLLLTLRRAFVGGELGGQRKAAIATAVILVSLWVVYLVLSILKGLGKL